MILRDYLAIDRTGLANERTFLAYIRTCVGLFATGAALINFVENDVLVFIGYIFIILSPVLFVFGFWRFIRMMRKIKKYYDQERKT
jgi:putative membrane protein